MAEETPNPDQNAPREPDAPPEATDVQTPSSTPEAASAGAGDEGQFDETKAAEALDTAAEAAASISSEAQDGAPLPDFEQAASPVGEGSEGLHLLNDVQLHVKIELGRTRMHVEDVLRLNENSVVELDKAAGDPVDIFVNDRHVARGEVLVLNDSFCVRVSEIVQPTGTEG